MSSTARCPKCAEAVDPANAFCPKCGLRLQSLNTAAEIDAYITARIGQELDVKLEDEDRVATSVAVKAEEQLWKWVTRIGGLIGISVVVIGAILGYFGVRSFQDTIGRVASSVTTAAKQVEFERDTIAKTAAQSTALRMRLDVLSSDVQTQADRVKARGFEIAGKLEELDKAEATAEASLQAELARARNLSDQLAATDQRLQKAVTQIAQQQDNIGIREAYPTLGLPTYVVYNNSPWRGAAGKASGQRWLSLYINSDALTQLSVKILTGLADALRADNVITYPGYFGTGGAQASFFIPYELLGPAQTSLIYFRSEDAAAAAAAAAICSKALGFSVHSVRSDPASWTNVGPLRRLVASQSGLDFQLLIQNVPSASSMGR